MVPGGGGTPTRGEPRRIGSLQQSHRSFNAIRLPSILRITSVLHSVALDCTRARSAVLHFVFSFSSIGFAAIRLLDESERGGSVTEKALRCAMLQKKWAG